LLRQILLDWRKIDNGNSGDFLPGNYFDREPPADFAMAMLMNVVE